jgi:FkbM family methyltransferase
MESDIKKKGFFFSLYIRMYRYIKSFLVAHPSLDHSTRKVRSAIRDFVIPVEKVREGLPNPFRMDGLLLYFRSSDQGDIHIIFSLMRGGYEPETIDALCEILHPGSVFVDLGAHIGLFSLLAARLVQPHGKVFAFEADVETVEILQKNIQANAFLDCVEIVPMAVYSSSGEIAVHRSPGRSDSTSVQGTSAGDAEVMVISMTSLDDYFSRKGWPRVDAIKMDVEGAEIHVLQGMGELLKRFPDIKLITELNMNRILQAGHSLDEMMMIILASGFNSLYVLHPGWGKLNIPADLEKLNKLVKMYNVNILCER